MSQRSIFWEDWQSCLLEHYLHVIRIQDEITEPSLRTVLLATDFTEDELKQIIAEALGESFIPPDFFYPVQEEEAPSVPAPVLAALPSAPEAVDLEATEAAAPDLDEQDMETASPASESSQGWDDSPDEDILPQQGADGEDEGDDDPPPLVNLRLF